MNVSTMERSRYQWEFAADSMPQLICLLDREGRIIRANRTIERWTENKVEAVGGLLFHELLHKHCSDPFCYLKRLSRPEVLAQNWHVRPNLWDPVLNRQVVITTQLSIDHPERKSSPEDLFAVVTVDDVTELRVSEDKAKRTAMMLNERYERETEKRINAEKIQSRLLAVFDKTPSLVAMADHNGVVCYLNPAGRKLLKLETGADINGISLGDCHAPRVWLQIKEEAIPHASRDGIWTGDSTLVTRDGDEIKTGLTLIAHRNADGKPEVFTFLESDMTNWIRTEEALAVSRNELRRLAAQHLTIQEMERKRVASDLHDGLGQSLSLLKMQLEGVVKTAGAGAMKEVTSTLHDLIPKVKGMMNDLRNIAMNLRPAIIDEVGIRATISWFIREIEESGARIKIEKDINVAETDVPQRLKIAIFRILQEATNNALKHAEADRIMITLGLCAGGDNLELGIEDDGAGFDALMVEAGALDHGLGLQSMRERVELSGGNFELVSTTGRGTRIRARWPRAKEPEARGVVVLPRASRMIRSISKIGFDPLQDTVGVLPKTSGKAGAIEVIAVGHRSP